MIKITVEVNLRPIIRTIVRVAKPIGNRICRILLIMVGLYVIGQFLGPDVFPLIQTACAISDVMKW